MQKLNTHRVLFPLRMHKAVSECHSQSNNEKKMICKLITFLGLNLLGKQMNKTPKSTSPSQAKRYQLFPL